MKRFLVAAALAATALVPASAGAIPFGSQSACGAGLFMGQGQASCRFQADGNFVGVGGFTDTGWTLTHKVRTAACVNHVTAITTSTVTDDQGGTGPVGSQPDTVAGVVYTLTVRGNGGVFAGGPSTTPVAPNGSEPADTAVDNTGGAVAGAAC